jgi:hypothetical protein
MNYESNLRFYVTYFFVKHSIFAETNKHKDMAFADNKNVKEKSAEIYREKDVLGLEEPQVTLTKGAFRPGRLWMGIGIVILVIYVAYIVIGHFY